MRLDREGFDGGLGQAVISLLVCGGGEEEFLLKWGATRGKKRAEMVDSGHGRLYITASRDTP